MAKSVYDHQVSFHVTKAMHAQLTRLADTRNVPIAEIGREAVRTYLSEQEDLQGSRKYFSKGLLSRLDYLEWVLTVLLFAVCKGLSALIILHSALSRYSKQFISLSVALLLI